MKSIIIGLLLMSSIEAYTGITEYGKKLTKEIDNLKKEVNYITPIGLKERIDGKRNLTNMYLLDVRTSTEVLSGGSIHIENYVNIPRGLVEFKIEESIGDYNSEIIVVCYSELRSLFVSNRLGGLGYKNVYVMKGGMERWNRECLPKKESKNFFIEKKEKASCGGELNSNSFSAIFNNTSGGKSSEK